MRRTTHLSSAAMRSACIIASVLLLAVGVQLVVAEEAQAGAYFNETEFTYKEYWADHSSYTAGCGTHEVAGDSFYIEPDGCLKSITLDIPDNTSNAIAAVIYVDLWRNRPSKSARFTVNDGPQFRPAIGSNFSRTPFIASLPLTQLVQGQNVLKFQEATGPYHVHDVIIRVYYDDDNPIVPGPNSDVTPPSGALTSVQAVGSAAIDPSVGGSLQVDDNQVKLTATAQNAAYVEFHAYYEGYDEDNDGVTKDWHNDIRNNRGPGGTEEAPAKATINHIGTDSNAPYEVTWNLPEVVNQDDVKFKIRVVDDAGNAVETPGGVSAAFSLDRTYSVESYTIPNFPDQAVYFDGAFPQIATLDIELPDDLNEPDRAILIGKYWNSPDISINNTPPFPAYEGPEDHWALSKRELDTTMLKPGTNTIHWTYRPVGFGAMIEAPGPMIVIHRDVPTGPPVITSQPEDVLISTGESATLRALASGAPTLGYQWQRDGSNIVGATSSTYTTPALLAGDDGATYRVVVTNGEGSATSNEAMVNVAATQASAAPWWDTGWDYRVPLTVFPESVKREDKVVSQLLNFSDLMAEAGSGGPTFDPNALRVVEVDASGNVLDAAIPFQFDESPGYDAVSDATGTLLWQLTGTTPANQVRYFHAYFDKTYKAIAAATVAPQISRTVTTDSGFPAYRFDLSDGSEWFFHYDDGGGFSKILDEDNNDWIAWNNADGTAGDFRGLPNAVKPPAPYFHPGRNGKTRTSILHEGPLRITFETRAKDSSWISLWSMYPDTADFSVTRANQRYWVLYEGLPGGEVDDNDFVMRSDGVQTAIDGTFESDLPGQEWMYIADPGDSRSFFLAHHQDDGAVDSYRLLNDEMPILGFGRGGLGLNSPYLRKTFDGGPQSFTFGLAESTTFTPTSERILDAYQEVGIEVGEAGFNGTNDGAISDDFAGSSLSSFWTLENPVNDETFTFTGSALQIDIPAGPSHDLWAGRDFAPRIMQTVGDDDFDIVVGFESIPSQQFQGQGLLFREDANNWIRYSVEHDGTRAKTVAYKMVDGQASQVVKKNLPGIATRFLRVIRSGDTWTFQRSYNGTRWFAMADQVLPFTMNEVGVVGTTHGSTAPAFQMLVDYFESKNTGTINDDAPQISNVSYEATSRQVVISWDTNVDASTRLHHGPTTSLGTLYVDDTPKTQHSVTVDFLGCDSPHFVQPQSASDVGSTLGEKLTVATEACSDIVSDDFSAGTLGDIWMSHDPVGDVTMNLSATNVVFSLPADTEHNLYADENQAARLRQEGPIGNFGVEAKFESVLNRRFQLQGIVVEEDEDSFLRFEVHHDGSNTKTYIAKILNGVADTVHSANVAASTNHHLRVERTGNSWTMSHSPDGTTWTAVSTFTADVDSAYVGPYVGNTSTGSGQPPAFLGSIDYFFNMASPIDPEDGGSGADTTPPTISDVVVTTGSPSSQAATVTWTTDEPSTTKLDWGFTNEYNSGTKVENTAVTSHEMVLEPLNCGVTYHLMATSNDAAGNSGNAPDETFTTANCPTPFSDNFDANALDSRWFEDDPRADGTLTFSNGLMSLAVPAGVRHDLTPNNNGAYRALQAIPDGNFEVMVGFESPVNFNYQLQGIVFEEDDNKLLRFDLSNDGSGTKAYVGVLNNNNLQTKAYTAVTGAAPSTLRVTRTGTNWKFEYSPDRRVTWQTIWEGEINLTVARVGPFAGNANPQISNVPPHSALVDYFWTSVDPITITEPGNADAPQFTIFGGASGPWNGEALKFGSISQAQPDANVRGRVIDPDGIRSLTYSVNGGAPVAMGIGSTDCEEGVSCTRRLANDGDFNADVNSSDLNAGLNTVTLRAVDNAFNSSTINVPIDYTTGSSWPIPYTIDWSSATDLYDVAQPIDGRWNLNGNTLHIDEIGYDRLIAVGDDTWSSFEAEVPVTINSFDPEGYHAPSGGPGIGFIPHWRGHTQAEFTQPKYGFSGQLGALAWYRYRDDINAERLEIRDSDAVLVAEDLSGFTLDAGTTYTFKMQAETGGGSGPLYRLKVWEQSRPEPAAWNIVTALPPTAPDNGALLLVAHHVDADFGNLNVRQIQASAPEVSPSGANHVGLVKVEMSTTTRAGEIRYTLDGSTPDETSELFDEPFFVNESVTVKAMVFRNGFTPSAVTEKSYTVSEGPDRVIDSLEALYRFDEGSGSTVGDTSLQGDTLDLTIDASSDVTWLGDKQALRINGASIIGSSTGANAFNAGAKATQAATAEFWIDPSTFELNNATLLDIGPSDGTGTNLTLSQGGRSIEMALRTSNSTNQGLYSLNSGSIVQPQLHHLVYVRNPDNTVEIYIDGERAWDSWRGGSLNAWGGGYGINLANSGGANGPWVGDYYLVALYSDALSPAEIEQNYRSGAFPPPANRAPTVTAGPDITVVEGETATMAATAADDGNPIPPGTLTTTWTQLSGPGTVTFSDSSDPTATATLPSAGTYEFEWRADDSEKSTLDTMSISVIEAGSQAPAPGIDPPTGSYPGSVTVDITTTVPNGEIRYTTDGTDPTNSSPLYNGSFDLTVSTEVRARVYRTSLVESDVTTVNYLITPDSRVDADLIALYTFNEANGATIKKRAGLAQAPDLRVLNVGRTRRVTSGLKIERATRIEGSKSAAPLNKAIKASKEMTIEMWLDPKDITQTDGLMFGISANRNARNTAILQNGDDLATYLRSQGTNSKAEPAIPTADVLPNQMTHLVMTRESGGTIKVYIDGVEVSSNLPNAQLGNWVNTHRLHFAQELDGFRSWLGTYYLIALYDRALTPNEVIQNFAFGDV